MSAPTKPFTITGATPATASTTAVIGSSIPDENVAITPYDTLTMEADIVGGTGGTLDIYVQRTFDGGTTWRDYVHFPQVAAATTKRYSHSPSLDGQIYEVGQGTTPALAAGTSANGKWGSHLRVLAVSGSGTSAAGSVTVKFIFGRSDRRS